MHRLPRLKISKETLALNDTLDQMNLIAIHRTFHAKAAEYTLFSSAQGASSRIDHRLGHKRNLSKFKKTETVSNIFADDNAIRLEINYKKELQNTQTKICYKTTNGSLKKSKRKSKTIWR